MLYKWCARPIPAKRFPPHIPERLTSKNKSFFFSLFFFFLIPSYLSPLTHTSKNPTMSTLSLGSGKLSRPYCFHDKHENNCQTMFPIIGRDGFGVNVLTHKGYHGVMSSATVVEFTSGGGWSCQPMSGTSIRKGYSEVKRFTSKIALEKHNEFLAEVQKKIDAGEFNLAGQA